MADNGRRRDHHRRRTLHLLARAKSRPSGNRGQSAGVSFILPAAEDETNYRSCPVELPQFFSDAHTLRESRKQSTGVDDPSASKRCSSTPLHCKAHFSRILRAAVLATR